MTTTLSVSELMRYEDKLRTEVVSPLREQEVMDIFKILGQVKKIKEKENGRRIYDYEIPELQIAIEVTSINTTLENNSTLNLPENELQFIAKLEKCIRHAEGKHLPPNYAGILVIHLEIEFTTLKEDVVERIEDVNFITNKTFANLNRIKGVLFLFPQVGVGIKERFVNRKGLFYCKSDMFSKVNRLRDLLEIREIK